MLTPGPILEQYAALHGDTAQNVADHFNAGIKSGEWTEEEVKAYIKQEIQAAQCKS